MTVAPLPPAANVPPGLARRLLMGALALLIVYGNLAVTFHPAKFGIDWLPPLPAPLWVRDTFLLGGMFTGYSNENCDYIIQGLRLPTEPGAAPEWLTLALADFFPQRRGVIGAALGAFHHWDTLGVAAEHDAWRFLARKIRERQNRIHPDRRVSHVRFGVAKWPISPLGFDAGRTERTTSYQVWYWE